MGKKYIIELEETPFVQHFKNGAWETIYRVKGFNSLVFDWNGLQMLTPYTEPDLERVRKEAYEKGYKAGKEHCPGQLSCMDVVYQKGFRDGTKQCVNCEDFKENAKKEAYQRGLADAWEAARKIWEYDTTTLKAIFGEGVMRMDWFMKFTASEAIEKIRQYEQEKEEQIQVGDEVIATSGKAVIVGINDDKDKARYIYPDSTLGFDNICNLSKTGRHFPEIAEVLQKMKETNNGQHDPA